LLFERIETSFVHSLSHAEDVQHETQPHER
jgi:hypothetical protein